MSVRTRLLIDNVLEVVPLVSVKFPIFKSIAQLLLQARNAHGGFPLLFLSACAKSRRCTGVALPLFVSNLRSSLNVNRNLYMMSLLAFDRHDLNATLTCRSHGYPTTVRVHSHRYLMGFLHLHMTRSGYVMVLLLLLLAASIDLARCDRSGLAVGRESCDGTGTPGLRKAHARSSKVVADHGRRWGWRSREVGSTRPHTYNRGCG